MALGDMNGKHQNRNSLQNIKAKYLYCTRKISQATYLNTGYEQFEQVNSFKYLGSTVNTDNSIEEEIKERIATGNRAYRVHNRAYRVHNRAYRVHNRAYRVHKKKLLTLKLISRNVKLQIYNTLLRPK